MDQDDPEKRIAELERQLAEQKRIAELEHQIAQAKVAAQGQDVPMPPPQPGQPTGFKGAWVSVDGGGFQQVSGQGMGAALPPQAAEQLAGLVNNIVHQAEVSGQGGITGRGGFAGQGGYPGQVSFGSGQTGFPRQRPRGKLGGFPLALFITVMVPVVIVCFAASHILVGAAPSSVQWMSGIVCDSGDQLADSSRHYTTSSGGSGKNVSFQCVSGASSYPANDFAIMGLQFLVLTVVVGGAVAAVLMWRQLRKPR
jgi:hypothetical protein